MDNYPIDTPKYNGQSEVFVYATFQQGNERYTKSCYAYSTRSAVEYLIPDMPKYYLDDACKTLGRPNDFHAAPYKGYGWWTIKQEWAYLTKGHNQKGLK